MKIAIAIALFVLTISLSSQTPKSITYQTWKNGAWLNDSREVNSFDASGYVISDMQESWTPSVTAWRATVQNSYTNNAAGLPLKCETIVKNDNANTWDNLSVRQTTYTAKNKIQTSLYQGYYSGVPQNNTLDNYFYDLNGYETEHQSNHWSGSAWVLDAKTTYTNNSQGFPVQHLEQKMVSGIWVNQTYVITSYFAADKISEFLQQDWSGSAWMNSSKGVITYDLFAYPMTYEYYEWKNGAWIQTYRITYTNRADGRIDYIVYETDNGAGWENDLKLIYDWTGVPTGIREFASDESSPAIYFDFNGRQVEKQSNVLLIEQKGNVRRKVLIRE